MAYTIRKTIDELMQACDTIHDNWCIGCPIEEYCLRDVSVEEIWNSVSESRLQDFIDVADKLNNFEDVPTEEDEYINANYLKWKEDYYEDKYGREE